jgi:hypothetical protein
MDEFSQDFMFLNALFELLPDFWKDKNWLCGGGLPPWWFGQHRACHLAHLKN